LKVRYPTSNEKIIDLVRSAFQNYTDIDMCVFSHITSIPAIIWPVKELGAICKQNGALVLIDGAHALGQIPVNVLDLNCDFWLGNGHKWLYSPKGSAILWTSKKLQNMIYPTTISEEGIGKTQYQLEFSWTGTYDYSAYLSMSEALKFRETFGEHDIMKYIHQLAIDGGELLAKTWKTEFLIDQSMTGAMCNIRIPTKNYTLSQNMPTILLERYDTWVPTFNISDNFYVRVSAQIYNSIEDFQFLANAVLQIINQ